MTSFLPQHPSSRRPPPERVGGVVSCLSCSFAAFAIQFAIPCLLLLALTTPSHAQTFTLSTQSLPGVWGGSAAWGDYDADGDPDLLLAGLTGPADSCAPIARVYRNDGGALTDIGAGLTGVYLGEAAWSDYDGDGDLDVTLSGLTADNQNTLKIYRNDGGRFLEDLAQTELVAVRFSALDWGDYDSDGDLDLVASGRNNAGNVGTVLYQNTRIDAADIGSPLGGQPVLIQDNANTERLLNLNQGDLAWGDIDGDGDLDLALSGWGAGGSRQVGIYLNRLGGSLFQDDRANDLAPVSNGRFAWGDFDNDGDLDLALSGWGNGWETAFQVYDNTAGILRQHTISGTRVIGALAWADFDNDGDLDLAASGQTAASDRAAPVFRNGPLGTLQEDLAIDLNGLRGGDLAWADLDGDGVLDLLLAGEDGGGARRTQLYTGGGVTANAAPNPPTRLSTPIVTGGGISLSWNDGTDDRPASALTYTLRIGTSPGGHDVFSGALPAGPGNVGSRRTVQLAIPFARDTYYWAVRAVDGGLRVSQESQEELFRVDDLVSSTQSLRPLQDSAIAWGDYDNDGDIDLAMAGRDRDNIARALVYRNDGGNLVENSRIVIQGAFNGDLAWADFDNDDDLDLVLTGGDRDDGGNLFTHVYRNRLENNDFALVVSSTQNLPQLKNSSLALGDYDNDGDIDLALAGFDGAERSAGIYRNDDGTFVHDSARALVPMDIGKLAWGDFDNDGDIDLAAVGRVNDQNEGRTVIYRNDSRGVLVEDTRSALRGLSASNLALGDFDSDGDLDLAVNGFDAAGYATLLYRNDGAGVLADAGAPFTSTRGGELAWGDFDNDGDIDLALSGQTVSGQIALPVLQVYRNGAGTFEQVRMDVLAGVELAAVAWGDYDNDGDLDLVSSGRNAAAVPFSQINDNLESRFNPNRRPVPPVNLVSDPQGNQVGLAWDPGFDPNGTPQIALTYALRVGAETGGGQVRSGAAPLRNGRIRHTEYRLFNLASGRYFWSARAIDKGLLSSFWSAEATFIIDIDKPVVDSVRVRPPVLRADRNRATVVVTFNDEPAGMDNAVSPQVGLRLGGNPGELSLAQVSFNGNLWIGETDLQGILPSGTAVVTVRGAADRTGNVMDPFQTVLPADLLLSTGGIVESEDGLVSLTLFPSVSGGDLTENPSIEILPAAIDNPPAGAAPVGQAYRVVATPDFAPQKAATLTFRYTDADPAGLAVYRLDGAAWTRLGGTADASENRIRVPVAQFGTFALFQEAAPGAGAASVTDIDFSNRAFSPGGPGRPGGPGGGAPPPSARLASPLFNTTDISFTLGAAAAVRIEIYNRAGQLQRVLEPGRQLGPGRHVFTWDGRDADGRTVRSGLYIVVIEAGGAKTHKTVAVVNNE